MKWTWLSSCYGFNMRVWVGDAQVTYPARWFFADPNAEWFPNPHGAEAAPWLKQFEVNREWGDDDSLKKLDRGINPGYPGNCYVGDPQWFIDGHLPASILTAVAPQTPLCCGHTPPINLDPRCPPFRHLIPCSGCDDGSVYSLYKVTVRGGTGGFAYFNGVHFFRHEFTTSLLIEFTEPGQGLDNQLQFWFSMFGCLFDLVSQSALGTGAVYQRPPPLDCLDVPFNLPLWFNTSPDTPPTITIG